MAERFKLGKDAKLYIGDEGTDPATVMDNIKDLTLNCEKGEADVSTRGSNGWKQTLGTLKDASIEFEMVWDPEDVGFAAIADAYFGDTLIAVKCLDEENGIGLLADFSVIRFSKREPLTEAQSVSVTIKPARSDRAPQWLSS